MQENNNETVDFGAIFSKLWHKKKSYAIVLAIAFVVGCVYILPVPRTYSSSVSLAPEGVSTDISTGTIGSLASSFGIDLGGMQSPDAFYPLLYPDVIASSNFIVPLFSVHVKTSDGTYSGDYFNYLATHQKHSPWDYPSMWLQKLVSSIMPKKESQAPAATQKENVPNTFFLTKQQDGIVQKIKNNIVCNVDRKTNVISITIKDQDPLVCATMADSVRVRLQQFITDYRTSKAKQDVAYYQRLTKQAKADYERVRMTYGSYADANMDVVLESFKSKTEDLENDMQLKFNTYSAFNTQLQAARANLQKRTPAFTIIQGAQVPIIPSGPKRMLTIIGIMFLAFIGYTCYLLRKDIASLFTPSKK